MVATRVDEIEVDLVADENQVVTMRQFHHGLQIIGAVEVPGRVVWTAQQQDAGSRLAVQQPGKVIQVEAPTVGVVAQGTLQAAPAQAGSDIVEVRVDGRGDDDPLARTRERSHDGPDALQHVRRRDHEFGIGAPLMADLAPVRERAAEVAPTAAIAHVGKVGEAPERLPHHGRRPQIVLGDPRRQNVRRIQTPFEVPAGQLGGLVHVVGHRLQPSGAHPVGLMFLPTRHGCHCCRCRPSPGA